MQTLSHTQTQKDISISDTRACRSIHNFSLLPLHQGRFIRGGEKVCGGSFIVLPVFIRLQRSDGGSDREAEQSPLRETI